jgi:hypothetical protein
MVLIPALLSILPGLLDKLIPDPRVADEAKLKMLGMAQNGELAALTAETDLAKGQLEVNKTEAASPDRFVSGWRPFIGWVCGFSIAYKYIGSPFLALIFSALGSGIIVPEIDATELWPVMLGLLGLGAQRSYDKQKGTSK